MHITFTRAGALGLAVATAVASLILGSPAATAAPAPPSADEPSAQEPLTPLPRSTGSATLVFEGGPGAYFTPEFSYDQGVVTGYSTHPTAEAAEGAALRLDVLPSPGGWFQLRDPASRRCASSVAAVEHAALEVVYQKLCDDDDARRFRVVGDRLESAAHPGLTVTGPTTFVEASGLYTWNVLGFGAEGGLRVVGDVDDLRAFSVDVDSVDIPNRSAVVSGQAAPESYVVVEGLPGTPVGPEFRAGADGTWSGPLTGLALGSNPLTFTQYENQVPTAETTLDVELAVRPLVARVTFPADHGDRAVLSGTAHPGAVVVVVRDSDESELARVPASSGAGIWSTPVSAPDAGGDHDVSVRQEIDGEVAGHVTTTVSYGAAVAVTTPVDDAAHGGGRVEMTGTGEPGAGIRVREEGRQTVLGSATVLQNGRWSLRTTVDVDSTRHVLEATQSGRGRNTTVATVTLNPEGTPEPPVITAPTIESPADGTTVTTPRPTISGHGHDGATISVETAPGQVIGTGTVEGGTWTVRPTRDLATGPNTLTVVQTTGDDVQSVSIAVTRVAADLPLRVTSHVDGQLYDVGTTTFRGTAPVGSTVVAKNQWNTLMGSADATDGTWAFDRNLGPTSTGYELTFTATMPDGTPQVTSLRLVYGGSLAFQVTSPAHNSTYTEGVTTFVGRAAPNTTVVARNQWNTLMGTAVSGLDGSWSFDRYLGPTAAGYDISFVATRGSDVRRSILHLDHRSSTVPVRITSHVDGEMFRPGPNTLSGVGTPRARVSAVATVAGSRVELGDTEVTTEGRWSLPTRSWSATGDHVVTVTQTNPDETTSEATITVTAPVFAPLTLSTPEVGDTYENLVPVRFEGTATPFATVTVRSGVSDTVYRTVEADRAGRWRFDRAWGPDHDYVLVIEQQAMNGQGDRLPDLTWAPSR